MVKQIGDKWVAECTQCGWTGEAKTKEAARELLHVHLDIHRTPKPVTKGEESEKVSSRLWTTVNKPGTDPIA